MSFYGEYKEKGSDKLNIALLFGFPIFMLKEIK